MPVQINEMVIRANIQEPGNSSPPSGSTTTESGSPNKEEIIKECVEMVLEMLRDKTER